MKNAARLLLLLLFFGAPLRAEETARFLIERIDVRHLRHVSPDVIKSESRLHEGQTVTESELRDADSRIKRLPFVLDATFSLERGSVRDAYVLVITVNETRPLFYLSEIVPYARARNSVRQIDNAALAGARLFAGRSGAFHIAVIGTQNPRPYEDDFYSTVQAGYTRYGLFSGRAFASLTLNRSIRPSEDGSTLPGGVIGVALAPNETLTISYTGSDIRGEENRRTERNFETRLAYDTTNQPFFPTSGSLLSVNPFLAWIDFTALQTGSRIAIHDSAVGLELRAQRYWTLSDRLSFAAIGDGGVVHLSRRATGLETFSHTAVYYGAATARLSRSVGDINAVNEADRRLELSLRVASKERNYVPVRRDSATQVAVTWVRRDAWGVMRFGLGYSW
jgi:hypothetical protein